MIQLFQFFLLTVLVLLLSHQSWSNWFEKLSAFSGFQISAHSYFDQLDRSTKFKTALRFSNSPFKPMTSSALFWVLCIMLSTAFNLVFSWSNCEVDFIMTCTKFDILSKIWFFSFSSFCVSSNCCTFTRMWCNNSWSSCSLLGASFIGLSFTIWQRMHSPSKINSRAMKNQNANRF